MSESVNFTISLDRKALRQAPAWGLGDEDRASGNATVLFRYAMGLIPRLQAMRALGASDYGLLIRMIGAAGLPLPGVSTETERKIVADFVAIVRASEGA